ncbi:response regulator [Nostoc sp. CCY0012]|uniref:response regulator n=1 Tax=Nostoc sp. CCY0012 TaxID=1056123 RepID=UPI0039C60278
MLPEQQQRILGYFIEEARDHLNTIEQGLLNLQDTLNDPEMVNEVFRAAHSIKGGAAMLGLSSIQHTSHRLEDSFKVLKEHPVQVDQKLESLFLGVSDTLKVLLEHLSGPFGLSEEAANTLMSETEPVFKWLNEHLELLVQQGNNGVASDARTTELNPGDSVNTLTELFLRRDIPHLEEDSEQTSTAANFSGTSQEEHSHDHWEEFQTQVLQALREMLQLFKQKTTPESRSNLQQCCQQLVRLGQTWNLPHWCSLCRAAANAIANTENTYLTLAKIVITEIKQAQELVLQGREAEIVTSQQLSTLLDLQELELLPDEDLFDAQPVAVTEPTLDEVYSGTTDNVASELPTILQPTDSVNSLTEISELWLGQGIPAVTENTETTDLFFGDNEDINITNINIDQNGPEVGLAELNTLADLFEGKTPELDETWQQEEILDITSTSESGVDINDNDIEDVDNDLADFLSFDENNSNEELQISLTTTEDLNLLFGNNFLEKEHPYLHNSPNSPASRESEQSPQEMPGKELVGNLLALALDENELLLTGEVNQQSAAPAKPEENSEDLFLEIEHSNLADEISLNDYTDENPNIIQSDILSLDGLFDDVLENSKLSIDESEISDLFDEPPAIAPEISHTDDDLNDFWNQGIETQQPEIDDPLFEQDVAKALEESLFAAAASGEIFGNPDPQESIPSPLISFDAEEDDLTSHQQDEIFSLDAGNGDDLFADLTAFNSISDAVDDDDLSLQEIAGFSQTPEALDSIPEFTNQPVETSGVDSPDSFGDLEIDLFDSLDENEADNSQLSLSEIAPPDHSTYIQLDIADNLIEDERLFTSEINSNIRLPENLNLQQLQPEIELLDINVDSHSINEVDVTNIIVDKVDEIVVAEDDLFATATEDLAVNDSVEEETEITSADTEDEDLFAIATEELTENELFEEEIDITSAVTEDEELFATATEELTENELFEEEINITSAVTEDDEELFAIVTEELTENELFEEEIDITSAVTEDDEDLFAPATEELVVNDSVEKETEIALVITEDDEDLFATKTEELIENAGNLSEELLNIVQISDNENTTYVFPESETATVYQEEASPHSNTDTYIQDEFAELEALLEAEGDVNSHASSMLEEDFAALEALLSADNHEEATTSTSQQSYTPQIRPTTNQSASNTISSADINDEFSDLEKLLAEADHTISHSSASKPHTTKIPRSSTRRTARFEETMKVPVKQLDDMSNLVGELVVNRNTLEQDHERLRQSLDNLLIQVQHLSDVGARMQELYERSLLEASLLASRKTQATKTTPEINFDADQSNADTDRGFSELEMDRFTPFHTLSQEMIEFIVRVRESASDIDFVTEETERVARQFRQVTTQLQEGLTRARMVPFSQAIDRLRRGVRDNAIKYGKQVELVIEGGDTLIDKMILDHLTDPLTHMLNNAIAHGIETPEIRQAAGKQPEGYITIRAFHQGNQTVISVGDDGAGIDPERVKVKATQIGMITAAQAKSISRMEVYDLLFQPGFSIKDQADEISGRGVGMDVVRSEISEIRGIVNTDSTIGKGTTFTIRLPLTLSICKALCCVSDKARIAFPMDGVEDTLDIPLKSIQHNADGQSYISWRDTVLPFRPLKELLTFNRQLSRGNVYGGNRDDDMVSVVVVRSGNTLIALQIDLVLSEQEIVIKQFESPAPKPIGVAGATVLGDGRVMPIADVLEIIDIFQGRISKHGTGTSWQQHDDFNTPEILVEKIDPTVLIVDDSITVRELLSLTFNKAGYRVEQARDGQEAWDKLRSGLPCDIVFCDIEMPRCDGLELLSRIQKDSNLNHLPIAMLTSRGADKHRQMAIQLGASGYFTKPYLEEALLEAAVRMLKGEKLVNA